MRWTRFFLCAVFCALALGFAGAAGIDASAQTQKQTQKPVRAKGMPPGWLLDKTSNEVIHQPTRFTFARNVRGFERGRVESFDLMGTNGAVRYHLEGDGYSLSLSLFVVAGTLRPAEAHYAESLEAIKERLDGVRLISESTEEVITPNGVITGQRAEMIQFSEETDLPVRQELMVFKQGSMLAKVRARYEGPKWYEARARLTEFIRTVGWPR